MKEEHPHGVCHADAFQLFRVLFKPVGDFRQPADPVLWFAGAGKFMVFPAENTDAGKGMRTGGRPPGQNSCNYSPIWVKI